MSFTKHEMLWGSNLISLLYQNLNILFILYYVKIWNISNLSTYNPP